MIINLYGYPEEIDSFLDEHYADKKIYYSLREMGKRKEDEMQWVWIAVSNDTVGVLEMVSGV
tara:strand:+ start:2754 stop:2939 length:186 start_codon:yes stop_codon:yes gene_type:complete